MKISSDGKEVFRRDSAEARVWFLVVALVAFAACGALVASHLPRPLHERNALLWPFIGLAIAIVNRYPIGLHFNRQSTTLEFSGVPILIGMALVSPQWLMVAVVTAVLATHVLRKNQPVQITFNVATHVLGLVAALVVLDGSLAGASPVSPRGWLSIGAAMLTFEVVTNLLVVAVVTLNSGYPGFSFVRNLGLQLGLLLPIDCALAIVAIEAYWTQPWALLVLAGPGFGLVMWYRSSDRLRSRFGDLQSLYGFSRSLAEANERADILSVALREMQSILHCRHTELCVPQKNGAVRYSLDGQGAIMRQVVGLAGLETDVMNTSQATFLRRGSQSGYMNKRGFGDLMAVPVSVGSERAAVLIAADRDGDHKYTFEKADLDLLWALAAHLGTALTSCAHLDRLRKEVAAREHQAYHDSLTGLANRSLFTQVVSAALKQRKGSRLVAIMLMDLNGFKEINDTLGHHTGDIVLKTIGQRVNDAVGPSRLAARLGGDEFAFVIASAQDVDEVNETANDLLAAVSEPISVDGMVLSLRASIGVSLAPFHGADVSSLLKRADIAMYTAKGSSRHITIYDPKIDHNSTRRLVLASDLQRAVIEGGLELWYQPIADIRSNRIKGFEALIRWRHPELGLVSPDEFIPVAEQTGLIEPLTWWVLRTAMEELRYWRDGGHEFTMAVNVSARSLLDTGIVDRLTGLMADVEVAPSHMTLEITESSMMLDFDRSERILRRLSELGLRIAIDDFGTGYSSLSRLKVLPVDVVKIDRSFIKNLCTDKGDQAIVRSTIELARIMGHDVVAEGVEDIETWNRLEELGCSLAQGYYFAKPMTSDDCRNFVHERQTPTAGAVVRKLVPRVARGA